MILRSLLHDFADHWGRCLFELSHLRMAYPIGSFMKEKVSPVNGRVSRGPGTLGFFRAFFNRIAQMITIPAIAIYREDMTIQWGSSLNFGDENANIRFFEQWLHTLTQTKKNKLNHSSKKVKPTRSNSNWPTHQSRKALQHNLRMGSQHKQERNKSNSRL